MAEKISKGFIMMSHTIFSMQNNRFSKMLLFFIVAMITLTSCGADDATLVVDITYSFPTTPHPLKTPESSRSIEVLEGTPTPFEGKFDVGDHDLYIKCLGTGSPTVILEAGWGDDGNTWSLVQPEISKYTRICAYDRVGLGQSDPGPEPKTYFQVVTDLHTLLGEAGILSPYILVGHSLGGMYMLLFIHRYPGEVLGLILVDSSHPDSFPLSLAAMPTESPSDSESVKFYREWFSTTIKDPTMRSEYLEAGSLGDLPLIVLTAPNKSRAEDVPKDLNDTFNQIWLDLHKELALLSSNSTHIIIEDSDHFIHQDRPDLVIDAILTMIGEVRN
jgi:pimeloyl-ACP methyl ester carboxylesterase